MNRKRVMALVGCFVFVGLPLVGQASGSSTSYGALANYRTAVRCYQQSQDYMERAEWKNASSQAELGLAYDQSISDLWFASAYSAHRLGRNAAEVLPLLRKAVGQDKWIDYNKDSALLLYAELLAHTGEPLMALSYLEGGSLFPSAHREYIRVLCHYRIGTVDSYARARELVSQASRLYPDDVRFPQAFFTYELRDDFSYDREAAGLGRILSQRFVEMGPYPSDVYLSAAVFADPSLRSRILRAFDATGKRHPMYAALALREGLVSEAQAYEYFCSFAVNSVSLGDLETFVGMLSEPGTKSAMSAFLKGYQGTVLHDATGDGLVDLSVEYSRGRPSRIVYDHNQDGAADWIARCDFGVPVELQMPGAQIGLSYKDYPFIASMDLYTMNFKFVDTAVDWSPVAITASEPLADMLDGIQFFVPQLKEEPDSLFPAIKDLVHAAYAVSYPVREREGARMEISLLEGQVRSAQYFEGKTLYAQLSCENGLPKTRTVDLDGDGWFELTQNFGFSATNYLDYASPEETLELYGAIFGHFVFPHGIYIQQAFLDRNLDMEIDFGQEYTSGRGVVSTWGNPLSDNWVAQYVLEGGGQSSRALFRMPNSTDVVSVYVENAVPVRVTMENEQGLPYRDLAVAPVDGVYWLGDAGSPEMAAYLKDRLDAVGEQGRSMVIQMDEKTTGSPPPARFSAVKISDFYFGVLLDE